MTVVRTDNFIRANSASSLGTSWTPFSWSGSGSCQVYSDIATGSQFLTAYAGNYWSADSVGNDQFALICVGAVPSSGWIGCAVRVTGTGSTGYLTIWFSGSFYLFKQDGTSTPTSLGSVAGTLNVGDYIVVTAAGTTITVLHNNVQVLQFTDSTFASGSPAIAVYGDASTGGGPGSVSLWMGGDGATVPFAGYSSTDGNGVQTWYAVSANNLPGPLVLRAQPPSSPSGSYPHSRIFALPVSTGVDATFGDPFTVICQDLGAHNAYNATVICPSFPVQPWYANSATLPGQQQEAFMLELATFSAGQFGSAGDKSRIIGFSKSGLGGQGLQFKHPSVFAACASWDAPFMATALDTVGDVLTDPTFGSGVSGDPVPSYGTDVNFQANYRLYATSLTAWNTAASGAFTARKRLWIGGHFTFETDVAAYKALLTSLSILYDGTWDTADASHAWHDDWVAAALASIIPAGSGPLMAAGII